MRCALTPLPAPPPDAGAPANGEAAMADVEAARRSNADSAAASKKAPGAVPGLPKLLSGAVPDEACTAHCYHVSMHAPSEISSKETTTSKTFARILTESGGSQS